MKKYYKGIITYQVTYKNDDLNTVDEALSREGEI
jgi:hypothetical protein